MKMYRYHLEMEDGKVITERTGAHKATVSTMHPIEKLSNMEYGLFYYDEGSVPGVSPGVMKEINNLEKIDETSYTFSNYEKRKVSLKFIEEYTLES